MNWSPKHRYSAIVVFSKDLERVVLIHKLKPAREAGKANLPGGRVEERDFQCLGWCFQGSQCEPCQARMNLGPNSFEFVYARCAFRKLREETGLEIAESALKIFSKLRFTTPEGDAAECCFFVARGDVDIARTVEAAEVFSTDVTHVLRQTAHIRRPWHDHWIPTIPSLPYLVAMARQCLHDDWTTTWPLIVYDQLNAEADALGKPRIDFKSSSKR